MSHLENCKQYFYMILLSIRSVKIEWNKVRIPKIWRRREIPAKT